MTTRASSRAHDGDSDRVTVVVTSCGRQDLLERTLKSFLAKNTCNGVEILVVEDGAARRNRGLMEKFAGEPIDWIATGKWLGQIRAIDLAYSRVSTPYIFHLEDDWEFTSGGFIEKSLEILRQCPDCLQVHIRAPDDLNDHPLLPDTEFAGKIPFRRLMTDVRGDLLPGRPLVWNGFSFNPGLRRLADYEQLKPFHARISPLPGDATRAESEIGALYRALGRYSVVLSDNDGKGYVRHIGEDRHVREPIRARLRRWTIRAARLGR